TLEEMERLRGLLSHKHPDLSLGELVALVTKMALEKLDPARERRRKPEMATARSADSQGNTQAPKLVPAPELTKPSRYIVAQTRRDVWKKAHGKCENCGGLYRLQIDHVQPHALGGSNRIENLRLLCFHCNQREADLKLGREKMEVKRGQIPLKLPTASQ